MLQKRHELWALHETRDVLFTTSRAADDDSGTSLLPAGMVLF